MNTARIPLLLRLQIPWLVQCLLIALFCTALQATLFVDASLRWHEDVKFATDKEWIATAALVGAANFAVWLLLSLRPFGPASAFVVAWMLGCWGLGAAATPPEGHVLFDWTTAPIMSPIFVTGPGPYQGDWVYLLIFELGAVVAAVAAAGHALLVLTHRSSRKRRLAGHNDWSLLAFGAAILFLCVWLSMQDDLLVQTPLMKAASTYVPEPWRERWSTSVGAVGGVVFILGMLSLLYRVYWVQSVAAGKVPGLRIKHVIRAPDDVPTLLHLPGQTPAVVSHEQGAESAALGRVVVLFNKKRAK